MEIQQQQKQTKKNSVKYINSWLRSDEKYNKIINK